MANVSKIIGHICSRSFAGAWIETAKRIKSDSGTTSLLRRSVDWNPYGQETLEFEAVAPSQERGLKHASQHPLKLLCRRSFAGAWIETLKSWSMIFCCFRRSFAGAWIETFIFWATSSLEASLLRRSVDWNRDKLQAGEVNLVAPSQERGLKHHQCVFYDSGSMRRSFAGAWIETDILIFCIRSGIVAPSQERGLKL